MTRQVGNEIDEFVTDALRNNLLGLPLDLATLNIARGRDTGLPSLNEARADFFARPATASSAPYTSWFDFALHLKNQAVDRQLHRRLRHARASIIAGATTLAEKRARWPWSSAWSSTYADVSGDGATDGATPTATSSSTSNGA